MKITIFSILSALIFAFGALAFSVPFLPAVGGKPSKADKENYLLRAKNFDGKKFHNPNLENESIMVKTKDIDSKRLSNKPEKPQSPLPVKIPSFIENPKNEDFTLTWFGHSTLLIQMHGMNILFDPVFSKRTSPVSWIGPKRFSSPTVKISGLPKIDILILTHDHYDHLDYESVKELSSKTARFIVPLGIEAHLRKWKIPEEKITNMAWWEEININGLAITATPAQHFSGRWITGGNATLWNSYVLKDEFRQIFESGDSGFGKHFEEIHGRFGDMDLALMECGQYNVRWPTIHSFPEESAQEAAILGAKIAMPIHWGAFVLSTNAWDDSVLRFKKAAKELNLNVITPYLCETADLAKPEDYKAEWWKWL